LYILIIKVGKEHMGRVVNQGQPNLIKLKGKDFTKCPYCGSVEVYIKTYMKGVTEFHYTLDGSDPYNGHIHDGLEYRENKQVYCEQCRKYLGVKSE
jgi:uncharacterized C2H2 Zn-finger protein